MDINNKYDRRGVSFNKKDVHDAIKNLDKGLFPNSFCKIIPDIIDNDDEMCLIMHADGAGTKSSLAYAYWKETNDLSVWKGISQDSLIMNIDDLICVGATKNIMLAFPKPDNSEPFTKKNKGITVIGPAKINIAAISKFTIEKII